MSLKVTGNCQVYKIEDKGNFVTGSLRTSQKNKEGEWESEFFNAKFVGKCKEQATKLTDKSKITIVESKLVNRKHKDKSYISVVIFEFTSGEAEEYTSGFNTMDGDDVLPF